MFDPSTGQCRGIYCQEYNHKFNGTMCIPDDIKKAQTPYKRMSDIDLFLTLNISSTNHFQRPEFSKRLHSQMNTTCTSDWNKMSHDTLYSELISEMFFSFKFYFVRLSWY